MSVLASPFFLLVGRQEQCPGGVGHWIWLEEEEKHHERERERLALAVAVWTLWSFGTC